MNSTPDLDDVRLLKANKVADVLDVSVMSVYELAASGVLEKRYIGEGTRNFRITYASLKAYVDSLSADPVPADASNG